MTTTFDQHKAYWAKKSGMPSALVECLPDPTGLQILDLGCGGGRLAAALAPQASIVYGIDNSAELLEQARQPGLHLICGDFQSPATWAEIQPLDLIVSNCAVRKDYCPHFSKVSQLCFDKLRVGGILLLRVEAVSDLSEVLPKSVRESLFYSKDELLNCLGMFKTTIRDESFRQRFSSTTYMQSFLGRIQIASGEVKNLNPTRRYYVVLAEKAE